MLGQRTKIELQKLVTFVKNKQYKSVELMSPIDPNDFFIFVFWNGKHQHIQVDLLLEESKYFMSLNLPVIEQYQKDFFKKHIPS